MAKRAKGYKIKKYNRIYRRNRNSRVGALGVVLTVAAVLLLLFIGWSIYDPVYDFLTGNMDVPSSSSEISDDDVLPPEDETDDASSEEEVKEKKSGYRAALIDFNTASDSAALDKFIGEIKAGGFDSAIIEIKDVDGNVLYAPSSDEVKNAGSVVSGAFDLKAVCSALSENEITPIVRIQSFRDNLAAKKMTDAAVRYKPDTDYIWADDDPRNGGKYWLNPNSEKAQSYILAIVDDAVNMGAEAVLLDSVQFPEGYSLNLCYFGEMSSKKDVLEGFIKKAEERAKEAKVFFEHKSTEEYLNDNEQYGVSPFKLAAQNAAVDLTESFKSGDADISDFNSDAYTKAVAAMREAVKLSEKREGFMAVLPENASGDLSSTMEALKKEGVESIGAK